MRPLLRHFLAAIAYRTQKALRGAPDGFADFRAGINVRTPHELLWHMTGVLGYARTMLRGGDFAPPRMPRFGAEVSRFHDMLTLLRADFAEPTLVARISGEQFLHGPLADVMTHVGQLAMLRRMAGSPVASENFIFVTVDATNVSASQAGPVAPDAWWRPDQPPLPPAPDPLSAGCVQRDQECSVARERLSHGPRFVWRRMAQPPMSRVGIEPTTYGLKVRCSTS
jgi:hypothetical protein